MIDVRPVVQVNPETGGITMLGRSDGVLNPQGVRFGSAELYQIVEEMKDECVSSPVFVTPADSVRQG